VESFGASLRADLSALGDLRSSLSAWLESSGVPEEAQDSVVLATHEAVANAIEHAASANGVTVTGERNGRALVIVVTNEGEWKRPSPDVARGRGLAVMASLMSELEIRTESRRTTVLMRKDL
jgi:serine/threonine-protein kinase RsbW